MKPRIASRVIPVVAMVAAVWPGTAMAGEESDPLTVAEQAVAHCRPAVDNAVAYEADFPLEDDEVVVCEVWTVLNAGQADLEELECLARATDAQTWGVCRDLGPEVTLWRRSAGSRDEVAEGEVSEVELARAKLDREIAENAGVLAALAESSDLEGIFGSSGLSSDLSEGIGGLIGASGVQYGSGGLGSRGSGLGGGGTAEGLGGLGTQGRGSGSGYGTGGGSFGTTGEDGATTATGAPIILGALSKEVIDQVIHRHMAQLRYCYQRELTKDPNITGKIVVKFTIAADGSVSAASIKSTTMNNESVENCVTGRFMRMLFAEPRGGGIVIVSYPILFSNGS